MPPALADAKELQQALLNLGLNARDAMSEGGQLVVRARCATLGAGHMAARHGAGEYVVLEVCDTGTGMDPETRDRAFEPFFSTKGESGGSGLGLAAVDAAVQRMDGVVRLRSTPGEGTVVSLFLRAASERPAGEANTRGAEGPRGRGQTLLVAEDEPGVREVMVHTLRENGYRVIEAADGDEALGALRALGDSVDLLCTDAVMPGRDVKAVIETFHGQWPGKPVLVCSGHVASNALRPLLESGSVAFLRKPFSPADLRSAIADLLDERQRATPPGPSSLAPSM